MSDTSLMGLGELAKPATVLIEKISDAIGGLFKPWQIRRVADAEAYAEKTRALTRMKITKLERRAMARLFAEEAKKQTNMESIVQKAIPQLNNDARSEELDDDWISNFFEKCRLISDEEMQNLWAKILAGEANAPGKYSKRTVDFVSSVDKSDAQLFTQLCGFNWFMEDIVPLIFDYDDEIYTKHGITFDVLSHFDEIGLLTFSIGYFSRTFTSEILTISYYGTDINIRFSETRKNNIDLGQVRLSKIGQELAPISRAKPVADFMDFVLSKWISQDLAIYSHWP